MCLKILILDPKMIRFSYFEHNKNFPQNTEQISFDSAQR